MRLDFISDYRKNQSDLQQSYSNIDNENVVCLTSKLFWFVYEKKYSIWTHFVFSKINFLVSHDKSIPKLKIKQQQPIIKHQRRIFMDRQTK